MTTIPCARCGDPTCDVDAASAALLDQLGGREVAIDDAPDEMRASVRRLQAAAAACRARPAADWYTKAQRANATSEALKIALQQAAATVERCMPSMFSPGHLLMAKGDVTRWRAMTAPDWEAT